MNSIPVNTTSVAGVVIAKFDNVAKILLLKRAKEGYWCHVAGKIEGSETASQAMLREIREEAGLVIKDLFSADYTVQFYSPSQNSLFMVPVFVAFTSPDVAIALNEEHTDFKWCSLDEAKAITPFPNQHLTYDHVWSNYCERTPPELMRVQSCTSG